MYNIKSFSWKNEKVLYKEFLFSYRLFFQFFDFYKMLEYLILNIHNVSDNNCIYLFIKIMVKFVR